MQYVVWIIGNGFDINYDLHTGYEQFLEEKYYPVVNEKSCRKALVERIGNKGLERKLWSDLELLLGEATDRYSEGEITLFNETFQDMELLIEEHAEAEQQNFEGTGISEKELIEFVESLCNFRPRLPAADADALEDANVKQDHFTYDFISLNYTTVFDSCIQRAKQKSKHLRTNSLGSFTYHHQFGQIIHPHGIIGDDGQMVFGVSYPTQIINEAFRDNELFRNIWLKQERNKSCYGNHQSERIMSIIDRANLVCTFGVSFGESDRYIWKQLARRLSSSPTARLVCFVKNLPHRSSRDHQKMLESRQQMQADLANAFELDESAMRAIASRIVLAPSDIVFRRDKAEG